MELSDMASRVLIVEDDEVDRTDLAVALRAQGYEIVSLANGLDALDYLRWRARPPACLVIDMRMPIMTGWELRKTLADDPTLRDIPLIGVTTGHWKPDDVRGFAALISKPIDIEELLGALRRCIMASPSTNRKE
jgi:CheY-like chemotaxis protein